VEGPFEGHNVAEFTLEPRGASTAVTWAMHGPNLFIGKVMSVFMSMDRMVGSDFETWEGVCGKDGQQASHGQTPFHNEPLCSPIMTR